MQYRLAISHLAGKEFKTQLNDFPEFEIWYLRYKVNSGETSPS